MIFIKHVLTLAAIVHLIACSEDAEEEGSSFPIGLNENTTIGFDDITEQSETSPSAASTIEAVTELNTEATLTSSSTESSTETASTTTASVKIARSASFAPTHLDYPLQSAQSLQPQYVEAPALCSCPCQSQQNLPYYPVPYSEQPQSVTYEDKLTEQGRDTYAHHAQYLPTPPQPPPQPTNYSPSQSTPAISTLPAEYSVQPPSQPPSLQPPPQPTNYSPPKTAPAISSLPAKYSVPAYLPPPSQPPSLQPPPQPTNYLPAQSEPAISSRPAGYSGPSHSPSLSYTQPLPCPRNILISCTPSLQRVPCVSSY